MSEGSFREEGIPIVPVKGGYPLSVAIQSHPDLIHYLRSKDPPKLNLKNREALLLYNKYIAKDVFGLDVTLESAQAIVPTPVLRFNFLQQILKRNSTIIELGTGPSALIAMLAAKHFDAKVFATEMDPQYLEYARKNVAQNNLEQKVTIIDSKGKYLNGVFPENLRVDYVISNPPYYDKVRSTKLLWGGKEHELVSGTFGEKFIVRMIDEGRKYLKSGGSIAFMIPKKRTDTLISVESFIQTIGYEQEIIGLKAGNRIRYVFRLYKQ